MVTRDEVRKLVDQIAEDDLPAVARYMEYIRDEGDPFVRALMNAPEDDEPETPEEAEAVAEGKAALARGEVRSLEEIRAEYSLEP